MAAGKKKPFLRSDNREVRIWDLCLLVSLGLLALFFILTPELIVDESIGPYMTATQSGIGGVIFFLGFGGTLYSGLMLFLAKATELYEDPIGQDVPIHH